MFEATTATLLRKAHAGVRRWSALRPVTRDAVGVLLLAPVVFSPLTAHIGAEFGDLPTRPYDALGVLLTVALWLPLVVRRRWPGACLAVVAVAFAVHELLGCPQTFASVGLYVALYGAGAHSDRTDGAGRLAALAAGACAVFALFAVALHGRGSPQRVPDFALIYAILVGCWLAGRAVRARQLSEAERRRLSVAAAMADERARIARELHDVVTHHVTAMVVQADASQFLLDTAPDRVATGLEAIGDSGRRALTDLRHLLGVLKSPGGEAAAQGPAPGRIGDLVERTRAAGQPVELSEHGERRPLASAVELAAYRVVQEALTNALKHAPGNGTAVSVRYLPDGIEVEVTTEGAAARPTATPLGRGGGHGLLGLRERVGVFGGELLAGHGPDGGFSVHARIPTGDGDGR
ncbi:histidine kinase [Streptomyces sp. NPDC008150]|uniref:sensor histidine kinase n=1 Tax=Streptomyces sp. NPDC008150 TaxID=3364816 RepID=UPI0036F07684